VGRGKEGRKKLPNYICKVIMSLHKSGYGKHLPIAVTLETVYNSYICIYIVSSRASARTTNMQQQQQQQQQRRRRRRRRRPRRTACRRGRGWGSSIKSTIRGSDAINLLADSTRFFVPREVTATTSARQASPPAPLPPPPRIPPIERASERERGSERRGGAEWHRF